MALLLFSPYLGDFADDEALAEHFQQTYNYEIVNGLLLSTHSLYHCSWGSPTIPLLVHQPAYLSICPAAPSHQLVKGFHQYIINTSVLVLWLNSHENLDDRETIIAIFISLNEVDYEWINTFFMYTSLLKEEIGDPDWSNSNNIIVYTTSVLNIIMYLLCLLCVSLILEFK